MILCFNYAIEQSLIYNYINVKNISEITSDQQLNAPIFIKELLPSSAKKGSSHLLSCTVTGNPLPIVQWFKNETNIDDSPDYVITYNNGEAVLKFLEILPDDCAIYTCKATNKLGKASTSANLIGKINNTKLI